MRPDKLKTILLFIGKVWGKGAQKVYHGAMRKWRISVYVVMQVVSVFSLIYITLFADRFSYSFPSWLWLPWKRNSRFTPPIITLRRYFTFTIKTFIHFPHFVSCGPQLTLLRSKAVRRHFFSISLFGNQLFNIAAFAVFLRVIFIIVTCLGNATVTETAAECYWKSMIRG